MFEFLAFLVGVMIMGFNCIYLFFSSRFKKIHRLNINLDKLMKIKINFFQIF